MKLEKILDKISYEKINLQIVNKNIDVYKVTNDSREVNNESIFVAVKGFKKDGHEFIHKALENGAKVILCENDEYFNNSAIFIKVKNTRKILSKLSSILYEEPSKKLNVIGVTGTNGKTSITYILNHIFNYNSCKTGIIGTMGASIDNEKFTLNNTTPESHHLQYFMKEMVNKNIDNCFMEVSSHSTILNRIDDIYFNIGIFTNLTKDHLDFHKTMEEYYKAKKKFFYKVESALINIDDKYGERLYYELKKDVVNVVSYSIKKDSDYKASIKDVNINGTIFELKIEDKIHEIKIKTPGKFSVYNTLACIIASYNSNIDIEDIKKSLENFKGVKGRFEIIPSELDCTIILDFAHTPDGLEKVMETIDEVAVGRKIVMFGAGGERDISRRALMGEVAGRYCDFCYLTSDNPRYENPKDICEEIAQGVKKHHNNYKIIIDRAEAINYIIDNYKSKDIILLAGKSTEPYQAIEDKKVPYDERANTIKAIENKEKSMKG
jgi:UDP-N-acetylmuramoyl-L-alanyl-D-glutamate--2,6-diaminopimelate ligase